jgi:hypothetical protein
MKPFPHQYETRLFNSNPPGAKELKNHVKLYKFIRDATCNAIVRVHRANNQSNIKHKMYSSTKQFLSSRQHQERESLCTGAPPSRPTVQETHTRTQQEIFWQSGGKLHGSGQDGRKHTYLLGATLAGTVRQNWHMPCYEHHCSTWSETHLHK